MIEMTDRCRPSARTMTQNFMGSRSHLGPMQMTTEMALGMAKRVIVDRGSSSPLPAGLSSPILRTRLEAIQLKSNGGGEDQAAISNVPYPRFSCTLLAMFETMRSTIFSGILRRRKFNCCSSFTVFLELLLYSFEGCTRTAFVVEEIRASGPAQVQASAVRAVP